MRFQTGEPNRAATTLGLLGLMLALGIACGAPQKQAPQPSQQEGAAAPQAGKPAETVQVGGPATGAGTYTADLGEAEPPDPAKFRKEAGDSP